MPRRARVLLPGVRYHIVQRGHNREIVFRTEGEIQYYLANVRKLKDQFDCKIYAYCIMTNHIHLIGESGKEVKSLSYFMKHLSARQTRYVNRVHKRTGTLWESRFHSSALEDEAYFLACCRYVELNPVRARIVAVPEEYPWSSYHWHAHGTGPDWLDVNPWYEGLGETVQMRQSRYERFMKESAPDGEWAALRLATQQNKAAGGKQFLQTIEKRVGWDVVPRPRGRPEKKKK